MMRHEQIDELMLWWTWAQWWKSRLFYVNGRASAKFIIGEKRKHELCKSLFKHHFHVQFQFVTPLFIHMRLLTSKNEDKFTMPRIVWVHCWCVFVLYAVFVQYTLHKRWTQIKTNFCSSKQCQLCAIYFTMCFTFHQLSRESCWFSVCKISQ